MKKYRNSLPLLIVSLVFLSGFSKDRVTAAAPEISISNARIVEGDGGLNTMVVMISLSQPAPGPIKISYATKDGKAKADTDYIATQGIVIFERNEVLKSITIQIVGEVVCE